MTAVDRDQLDNMDRIGDINEIIFSGDGQVRALVIGVGGFLGIGEHDIAVTMNQVTFASASDDPSELYVIVNTGRDMLKDAPAYDRAWPQADAQQQGDAFEPAANDAASARASDGEGTERTALVAPSVEREGYEKAEL